jgi:cytochrome P450
MTGIAGGLTLEELDSNLHAVLAGLRANEPVAWVPVLNGWLVTRRDLVIGMMRDPVTYTVDDPRFSTGQVVGPSMLSLDGPEHARHRAPFGDAFRLPEVRRRFEAFVHAEAGRLVTELAPRQAAELRRDLAGPLAVTVVAEALGLVDTDPGEVLGWYDEIVDAVSRASTGQVLTDARPPAVARLADHVRASAAIGDSLIADAARTLSIDEVVSNTAVLMFGGIETSEGMTANAFAHLLAEPANWAALVGDPGLVVNAVEESLRLEPAVVQVDRFATRDVEVAGARIRRGDFVMLSIAGANRDPAAYPDPDRFDIGRSNARTHLAFAHGPHACVGIHLAKLETRAALLAAIGGFPGLRPESPAPARGVVFRKPASVQVSWQRDPLTR